MDELISGLFVMVVAVAAVMLYVCVAGGAAAVLAVAMSIDAIAFALWRVTTVTARAIRERGAAQRRPAPPEPAFEMYCGRPLMRDFGSTLSVIWRELLAKAADSRRKAFDQFEGLMLPLAAGVAVGAYTGAAAGILLGALIALGFGLLVLLVGGGVWVGAHALQRFERLRRRLRGAHFDCPACHERSRLPVYVCPSCGAKHRQLLPGRWGIRRRRCECNQVQLPALEMTGRHALPAECPKCAHPMPGAGGIVPEFAFPIVGGPKSGKTAFLASVLLELETHQHVGGVRLAVTDASLSAFDRLTDAMRHGRRPDKTQVRQSTPAFVAEVRTGTRKAALLYAHDIAGELYQQADRVRDTPYLARAQGAVFMIDPFSLPSVAGELKRERQDDASAIDPSPESPQSVAERFLQALRESGRDAKGLSVAIVVSKADALSFASDALTPDASSDEVRTWLERNGAGNVVRLLAGDVGDCRYFALSALGRLPVDDARPFAPVGTLAPFWWLLSSKGVSADAGAETADETVTEALKASTGSRVITPLPSTPLYAPATFTLAARAASVTVVLAVCAALLAAGGAFRRQPNGAIASAAPVNSEFDAGGGEGGDAGGTSGTQDDESSTVESTSDGSGTPPAPVHHVSPAARVLRKHFERLGEGDYDGAFALMAADYRARNPSWPSVRSQAAPHIRIVKIGTPVYVDHGVKDVPITFYAQDAYDTAASDTICRRFSGTARMISVGSTWRYEPSGNHYSVTDMATGRRCS